MNAHTSQKTITFSRPFFLSGIGEVQPAGRYRVVTEEEEIPGLSFSAHRRVATLIALPTPRGGTGERIVNIDPLELQAAQEKDAESTTVHRHRTPPSG
jgi:hypothetical protein